MIGNEITMTPSHDYYKFYKHLENGGLVGFNDLIITKEYLFAQYGGLWSITKFKLSSLTCLNIASDEKTVFDVVKELIRGYTIACQMTGSITRAKFDHINNVVVVADSKSRSNMTLRDFLVSYGYIKHWTIESTDYLSTELERFSFKYIGAGEYTHPHLPDDVKFKPKSTTDPELLNEIIDYAFECGKRFQSNEISEYIRKEMLKK